MFYTVIRSGQFSAAEYLHAEHATFSALANRRERTRFEIHQIL